MSKEEFTVILSKSLPRLFPYSTPAPTDELPAETLKPYRKILSFNFNFLTSSLRKFLRLPIKN